MLGEGIRNCCGDFVKCDQLKSGDTHQTGDLADGDRDGRTSHETAYARGGNEFDNPTNSQEAYGKDDKPLG